MKKAAKFYVVLLIALMVATTGVIASPKIMKATKNGKRVHFVKRNGKRVNSCNYCHKAPVIAKKKAGYLKGQPKYRSIKRMPKCGGSGCH